MKNPKLVRVRIPVLVAPDGSWSAYGWGDITGPTDDGNCIEALEEMLDSGDINCQLRHVVALVALPDPPDVNGSVEAEG